jgi:hypothetical protein
MSVRPVPPHIYGRLLRTARFGGRRAKATKLVLLILREHMQQRSGYAWPAQETLAEEAEISIRMVRDALHAASRAGWIALYLRQDVDMADIGADVGQGGPWKSYVYRACCPDSIDLAAVLANKKTGQTAEELADALEHKYGEIPPEAIRGGIFRQRRPPTKRRPAVRSYGPTPEGGWSYPDA